MKKFVFSLESVLRYKHQLLGVLKNEMARLEADLHQTENNISKIEDEFADMNGSLLSELKTGLTAQNFAAYKSYLHYLNKQEEKLNSDKLSILQKISSKKQEIISMNSDISGLERLKDKHWDEYLRQNRKEQELLIEEFVGRKRCTAS